MATEREVILKVGTDQAALDRTRASMSKLADEAKRAGDGSQRIAGELNNQKQAADRAGLAFAGMARMLPGGGLLSSGIMGVQGVGGLLSTGGGGFAAVAGPLGLVAAAAAGAVSSLKGVAAEMTRMVGVFSPGHLERLNLAMGMVSATIGRALVPVVELMTEAWQGLAEVLANVLPDAADFRGALSPVREALQDLKQAFLDLAPLIKSALVEALNQAAFAVRVFIGVFRPLIDLLKFVGVAAGTAGQANRSAALPGGQPRYLGLEDVGREAALASLRMGQDDPQKKTADNTKAIYDLLAPAINKYLNVSAADVAKGLQAGAGADPYGIGAALKGWLLGGV